MLLPVAENPSPKIQALRAALADALEPLNERQALFVQHYARIGNAAEAARQAGYALSNARDTGSRLLHEPAVEHALTAAVALREATSDLPVEDAIGMLERMLATKFDDLLVLNDNGKPIDVRDWRTLGTAQQKAVKKLSAKVRRSAEGKRAHIVDIQVELVPALDIIATLGKLRGWTEDGALLNMTLAGSGDVTLSAEHKVERALYKLLDLFPDDVLAGFFAIPESDADGRAAFLDNAVSDFKSTLDADAHPVASA